MKNTNTFKIPFFLGLILLLLMTGSAEAQSRSRLIRIKRDWFDVLIFHNSLTGIGLGGHLKPVSQVSIDLMVGTESPVNVIWTTPYHGNIVNFCVKANLNLPLGLRISGGWFAGYYDITRDLPLETQSTLWQTAPIASIGIKIPSLFKRTVWYFELGSAFNLPPRIHRILNESLQIMFVEVERSASHMGSVFPFFSIIILY